MAPRAPDLIKDVKTIFGLSQTDLARVLGITQQAVSTYEQGIVKKERYDVIQKLKDILEWKFDPVLEEILRQKGMWDSIQRRRK